MLVAGRDFSDDMLSRIRTRVLDEPTLTRSALSREVCGWMQWQGDDERPKDVSCRVALLKLDRRGLIELPAARDVSFASPAQAVQSAQPNWLRIEAPLAQLGRVWLVPVDGGQADLSRTWWAMMQAHHPLGSGPLCGAQIRYSIACEAGVLGGLSFSAPAWRLAPRRRVDWLGRCGSTHRAAQGGGQQPVSDPARRAGSEPGLARVGLGAQALERGLAGSLCNRTGAGGDLRGQHPLPRHLLSDGQLAPSGSDAGSWPAGSCTRSVGHEQGHLGLSQGFNGSADQAAKRVLQPGPFGNRLANQRRAAC